MNYTDLFSSFSEYFMELDKICEEKNWDDITIKTLRKWLSSVLYFYNPNDNILEHLGVHEYINNSLEKLKQVKDIKVLRLDQVISNPNCSLFKYIKKIPFDKDSFKIRLSKRGECFILDENGDYYLSVYGECHRMDKTIELLDEGGVENLFHHELQHIDQYYIYPSEFPFASDMLKMLCEGEAEYHRYLINRVSNFLPIEESSIYYIYYLVYTLLMLVIPKEMQECWNSTYRYNTAIVSDIFKYISDSEVNRKRFSQLFALITLIVAYCNPQNTEEIINASVDTSMNRYLDSLETLDQIIQSGIEKGKGEYQNKGELSRYQILGDKYYRKYQYCQFGIEMNKKMKLLLSQRLTFKDLFRQLLESTICLINQNETDSTEKYSFIDKIIKNNLLNNKRIS